MLYTQPFTKRCISYKNLIMTKKILTMAALIAAFTFTACNKDNDNNCPDDFTGDLTTLEATLVGDWKLVSITATDAVDLTNDNENNPSTDIYSQSSDCAVDVAYTFNNDRTFAFKEGKTVADCQNSSTTGGTWKFEANQLSIITTCYLQSMAINLQADNGVFSITNSILVTEVNGNKVQTNVTYTYQLQV